MALSGLATILPVTQEMKTWRSLTKILPATWKDRLRSLWAPQDVWCTSTHLLPVPGIQIWETKQTQEPGPAQR